MSLSHLVGEFTRNYREPPMAFLRRQRMHQASRLLVEDAYQPIAEIAWRCGYRSSSLFARHFRRIHGRTPRQWRAGREGRLPAPPAG